MTAKKKETAQIKTEKNIYTYVGSGEKPPSKIDFMGMQKFVIGKPEEVTDELVLQKIKGHPCFVEGEADADEITKRQEEAEERVAKIRERNQEMQLASQKENKKFR